MKPKEKELMRMARAAMKEKRLARDAEKQLERQQFPAYQPPAPNVKKAHRFTCPHCGSGCSMKQEAKNDASGCFLVIVGLLLTPVLIGIPIIIYALVHGSKTAKYWACPGCRSRFDAH